MGTRLQLTGLLTTEMGYLGILRSDHDCQVIFYGNRTISRRNALRASRQAYNVFWQRSIFRRKAFIWARLDDISSALRVPVSGARRFIGPGEDFESGQARLYESFLEIKPVRTARLLTGDPALFSRGGRERVHHRASIRTTAATQRNQASLVNIPLAKSPQSPCADRIPVSCDVYH